MYKGIVAFIIGLFVMAIAIGQCASDDYSEEEYSEEVVTFVSEPREETKTDPISSDATLSNPIEENPQPAKTQRLDLRSSTPASPIEHTKKENRQDPSSNIVSDYSNSSLETPKLLRKKPEQVMTKAGYTVSYNKETKCANWVSWHLTKAHSSGPWSRKGLPYIEDEEAEKPRQELEDWRFNPKRYDHGHMCPAADNKWSKDAMIQSFYLTNMCPQNHNLNCGDWQELEEKCRDWSVAYGEIYIACGPIFYNGKNETMGGTKEIWVPDAFYKVVLRMKDKPTSIGFVYPNEGKHHAMSHYVCTVDEIEMTTGIDFFYNLPDDIENVIESQSDLRDWR